MQAQWNCVRATRRSNDTAETVPESAHGGERTLDVATILFSPLPASRWRLIASCLFSTRLAVPAWYAQHPGSDAPARCTNLWSRWFTRVSSTEQRPVTDKVVTAFFP